MKWFASSNYQRLLLGYWGVKKFHSNTCKSLIYCRPSPLQNNRPEKVKCPFLFLGPQLTTLAPPKNKQTNKERSCFKAELQVLEFLKSYMIWVQAIWRTIFPIWTLSALKVFKGGPSLSPTAFSVTTWQRLVATQKRAFSVGAPRLLFF